jgi:hypothetical protein
MQGWWLQGLTFSFIVVESKKRGKNSRTRDGLIYADDPSLVAQRRKVL